MKKTFILRKNDNHLIVFPESEKERDITEERAECEFCTKDINYCNGNKAGIFCDFFKMKDSFVEIEE